LLTVLNLPYQVVVHSIYNFIDLQNNSKYLFALNYYIELTAGQYVEVWWASSSANTTIEYLPLQTTPYNRPAVPSLIVTMSQI
jgi:hypothetical protein